ncbi:hypothetical protein RH915_11045 [Serpentinicella sp. ANB-PHB4]|nr:hypothetical protein [Serpentinicella sp. ANB-PHB4]MDR5660026.1 hypothetical protein [Serpentinicella sp. ANB-PHB4]
MLKIYNELLQKNPQYDSNFRIDFKTKGDGVVKTHFRLHLGYG